MVGTYHVARSILRVAHVALQLASNISLASQEMGNYPGYIIIAITAISEYYTLVATILFPGLPSFPVSDNVTQDPDSNTASEVAGSTVISWSPASVSGGGASYTVSLDGVAVASTTDTTATLTGLDFNQTYSVSVEAQNDCGQPSGSPLQGATVEVPVAGDYMTYYMLFSLMTTTALFLHFQLSMSILATSFLTVLSY